MWFDVSAVMQTLQADGIATPPQIADKAKVAGSSGQKAKSEPVERADGLSPDAGAYLDFLHLHGPTTYGAFAAASGWGATRAWRAEARLRAAGLVTYDCSGRTVLKGSK
ncbi:MAG: hypothetical protein V4712_12455 [Pseudomonadota bacterium]